MKALLEIKEGQEPLYNIQLNKSEAGDVVIPIFAFMFGTDNIGKMLAKLYLMQSDPEKLRKMTNDIKRQYNTQGAYLDFVEQICLMRIQHSQQRPDDFNKKPATEQATPATAIKFYSTTGDSIVGLLYGFVAVAGDLQVGYRARGEGSQWVATKANWPLTAEVTEEQANEGADKPFAEFYATNS